MAVFYALWWTSVILDVLMVIYLSAGRAVGRAVYGAAIAIGAVVIWLVGPGEFWGFVADRIGSDGSTWLIRLSFLFVLAAPWLKTKRGPGAWPRPQ